MKKLLSIFITLSIVFTMTAAFAESKTDRAVLMCYDDDGSLVYSKLLNTKAGIVPDLPAEYENTMKRVYLVDEGEFTDLDSVAEIETDDTADTEQTYVTKLMSGMPADKNYVISPLSLKMAVMIAANGAEGETQAEMLDAFDVDDIEAYNEQAKELIERLNSNVEGNEVNIANSVWFNKDYSNNKKADFSDSYKKVVKDIYSAGYGTVTDKNIVKTLNDWISKQTNGKIKNMVTKENLAPNGKLPLFALVNAIYMKARWINEFEEYLTHKDTFTDIDGAESSIDFMTQTSRFDFYDDGDTKIVSLPYENGLSMYVVLGDAENAENKFDKCEYKKVHLTIPKFSTDYFVNLNDTLKAMGVKKAFENFNPDFAPMINFNDPIKIETVMQKALIDVDEQGTEAAAVTVIGGAGGAAYVRDEEIVEFKADKPFTYYITDNYSGEILFAGRYVRTND